MIGILPEITKYFSLIMFAYIVYELCRQIYFASKDEKYCKIKGNRRKENSISTFLIIFSIAVLSRYLLYFIIYIAVYNPVQPASFPDALKEMLLRSDAPHYIDIARDFYVTQGDARYFIVFLPLYPVMVNIVNMFFGNLVLSAYVLSDICFGIACYFIYELAIPHIGAKGAKQAVILLLLFPVSFFFGGAFTESMFLMFCAIFFYLLDKKKYFGAVCIGFFAALTRNVGFLLAVPYIVKVFFDIRPFANKNYKKFFWYASYSLLIFLGMGVYILINKLVSDNAFQFLVYAKEHWSQGIGFFPDTVRLLTYRTFTDPPEYMYTLFLPEIISIFFALGVLVYGGRYLKPHYLAFAICYFAVTIGATWLLSAPRYLMVLIPLYLILGKVAAENKTARVSLYLFFGATLLYMTAAFSLGYYIY